MDLAKVSIRTIADAVQRGALQITEVPIARREAVAKEVESIKQEIEKAAKEAEAAAKKASKK